MSLVPPKEGLHINAVWSERCGQSEKQIKTMDTFGFEEKD